MNEIKKARKKKSKDMSGFTSDSLVPARFLSLLANLIVLILAAWSREPNVKVSLPFEFEDEEYATKDRELTIGLSLAISFIGIELIGFFSGISMFRSSISLLSIFSHGISCLMISQWLIHPWPIATYWLVFSMCSVLPMVVEVVAIVSAIFGRSKDM